MAFRTVKITNRCKLEVQLNQLVIRSDKEHKILLDEIAILCIESQQVCLTNALLSELINHKIQVVFCDEKHNPISELTPLHGVHNTYERRRLQRGWSQEIQDTIWSAIIRQKIHNQARLIKILGDTKTYDRITGFESEIQCGDSTNREGLSAKAYFVSLFGASFDRRNDHTPANTYLNYGYSRLLSARNREVNFSGYDNVFGIHHKGPDNPSNFSCDLREPFRPFIDKKIACNEISKDHYKRELRDILNSEILCDGRVTIMENAIHDFAKSVFSALNSKDPSLICKVKFIDEQL